MAHVEASEGQKKVVKGHPKCPIVLVCGQTQLFLQARGPKRRGIAPVALPFSRCAGRNAELQQLVLIDLTHLEDGITCTKHQAAVHLFGVGCVVGDGAAAHEEPVPAIAKHGLPQPCSGRPLGRLQQKHLLRVVSSESLERMVHVPVFEHRVCAVVLGIRLFQHRHPHLSEPEAVAAGDPGVLLLAIMVLEHREAFVHDNKLPL
mmetsp:Transcript_22450/g.63851  ORF Transcript_22450/g.63851 Transcript_22450/m.63851 type:complete len:204 (-) Transcript_22450:1009-1620(-)